MGEIFEKCWKELIIGKVLSILGSGLLNNLGYFGHFFGGSSGSHPQTKLSGCDPDITCSLENSVGIW